MPLYDYQCSDCGHRFELRQGFDADSKQECPRCQGMARRRFHSVGVIYKGSGFYTTDYKRQSYTPPGSKEDSERGDDPAGAPKSNKENARKDDNVRKDDNTETSVTS